MIAPSGGEVLVLGAMAVNIAVDWPLTGTCTCYLDPVISLDERAVT